MDRVQPTKTWESQDCSETKLQRLYGLAHLFVWFRFLPCHFLECEVLPEGNLSYRTSKVVDGVNFSRRMSHRYQVNTLESSISTNQAIR